MPVILTHTMYKTVIMVNGNTCMTMPDLTRHNIIINTYTDWPKLNKYYDNDRKGWNVIS